MDRAVPPKVLVSREGSGQIVVRVWYVLLQTACLRYQEVILACQMLKWRLLILIWLIVMVWVAMRGQVSGLLRQEVVRAVSAVGSAVLQVSS
jgi:hypothetical protein